MRTRFNEMIAKTDPPEPTCPRCGEYINEDDSKYCPCGAELDIDNTIDAHTLVCTTCGLLLEAHQVEWKCHKCGYDGKPKHCVVCRTLLSPKDDAMCAKCQAKEYELAMNDIDFETAYGPYLEENNRC